MIRHRRTLLCLLVSSFVVERSSFAQTTQPTLAAELGFSGVFKPDAWTPVYVRVTDDASRPATIELRTTRGRVGHVVEARIVTSVVPTTYTLYAPLGTLDRVTLQLRDGDGRLLREADLSERAMRTPAALGGPVFGIGGDVAVTQRVVNQLTRDTGEQIAAGTVTLKLLPDHPIGYAGLDVLVLPDLNTDAINDGVESAIVRWVRAGGVVVAWPGAQAATVDSPLRLLLPGVPGTVQERPIAGSAMVARPLAAPLDTTGVSELSDGDRSILVRRVGLGQVVLAAFDPSLLRGVDSAQRVDLWRRLTSGQFRLLASERRNGIFDALVASARGEQQLEPATAARSVRPILFGGLLLCLALGPGELILLAAARRHPRTGFTLVGLVGTVVFGAAVTLYSPPTGEAQRVEVAVETDAGGMLRLGLSNRVDADPQAAWLGGDRMADPMMQPAGELSLGQRDTAFSAADALLNIDGGAMKIRTMTLPESPTPALIRVSDGAATNASPDAWSAFAMVAPGSIALSEEVPAGSAVRFDAMKPLTTPEVGGRVTTGIERLAARAGWEALLMDRFVAARLVELQEAEGATLYIARTETPAGPTFVIHVQRVASAR